MLGRAREASLVESVVSDARGGTSGSLPVSGEPGIGKTVLLAHARAAAQEALVLEASGAEGESHLPFAGRRSTRETPDSAPGRNGGYSLVHRTKCGGGEVSSQRDSHVEQRRGLLAPSPTSYECYREARERYFERLRVDSEVRRVERMWRLPEATLRPIRNDD